MDIEQLKTTWRSMGDHIDKLEQENRRMAKELAAGNAKTAQERLAKTARRSIDCAVLLPLLSPLIYYYLDFPLWIAVLYASFGILMGIANLVLYNTIIKNDYMSLPLVEALASAVKIRRTLRNVRVLGICLGLGITLSLVFETLDRNESAILGGLITGFICGAIIGLRKWMEQTKLTRDIIRELRNAIHQPDSDIDISARLH